MIDGVNIQIFSFKYCFSILRCFGAKISVLHFDYGGVAKKHRNLTQYINQYLNQYCADTLNKITFQCHFPRQAFQKPFKNVNTVEIFTCKFVNSKLENLANSFPNLHNLSIFDCSVDNIASLNVSFPHLEHLTIGVFTTNSLNLSYANVVNLLQANQQLKFLTIRSHIRLALSTLLQGIRQNSSISLLVVVNEDHTIDVSTDELNCFAVERPFMTELHLKDYRLTADDAINFIRQMKSLKWFSFQVKDQSECNRLLNRMNNEWYINTFAINGKFYVILINYF